MPGQHALLSPSAAHRWMRCTAAPRLEATVESKTSTYTEEGTLAHAIAARKLKEYLKHDTSGELAEIQELWDRYHSGEMEEHTDAYRDIVLERYHDARLQTPDARLLVETRLDFEDYVPQSFGTSDAVIIADDTMDVIDLKYGKGVAVSAEDNPQMKIYALGAYLANCMEYGIRQVRMTIVQPRIGSLSTCSMPVDDLLAWADTELRRTAREAFDGPGVQCPGEWCQFCAVKSCCRALADKARAVAGDAADIDPRLIPSDEMARDILPWLPVIKSWMSSVEDYALQQALSGVSYPGYKLVEGRSIRRITDEAKVAEMMAKEGYSPDEYMRPATLCGISELEKLAGKKRFAALCSRYIVKPQGKPTLVPESDKRAVYTAGADDFNGIDLTNL